MLLELESDLSIGWEDVTSDFHSRPEDRHSCASYANEGQLALPFCNASCNSKLEHILFNTLRRVLTTNSKLIGRCR